jgi:uncharacterized membrane protein
MSALLDASILALVGVGLEVAFTALSDLSDQKLTGHSYLWMFPIYGLIYPALSLLRPRVGHWHWAARGALYVALLLSVEYISGGLLRLATGSCPWDYGNARWAVHGLIRLDYIPAWFGAVMAFEHIYLHLRRASCSHTDRQVI